MSGLLTNVHGNSAEPQADFWRSANTPRNEQSTTTATDAAEWHQTRELFALNAKFNFVAGASGLDVEHKLADEMPWQRRQPIAIVLR